MCIRDREKPYFFSIKNGNVDQVWIGGENYLKSVDGKGENEIDYTDEIKQTLKNFKVQTILEDDFQNIWIGTEKGLVLISPKRKLFQTFVSSKIDGELNSIRGIEEYNDEQLFVAGESGLILINKNTKDTAHIYQGFPKSKIGLGTLTLEDTICLLYTSPSPRDATLSRMPSSA